MKAVDLVIESGFAVSNAEARRVILQGCLKVNDEIITIWHHGSVNDLEVKVSPGDKVSVGRRQFTWGEQTDVQAE